MNRNSQTRITNDEIRRRNTEILTTNESLPTRAPFDIPGFGFLSSFVIRELVQGLNACEKASGGSP